MLFWLYLWRVVDLRLIAHCTIPRASVLPVFYRGWTFFRDVASHPGGLAEYAGAFLFQLFSYAWLGALAVTGLAWLLALGVGGWFSASGFPRLRFLRHVPALLLLAIYSQYAHCLIGTVALLAALGLVPLYLRISAKGARSATAFFIGVSPALYTLAGATYLIFAATCILHEALITRRWRLVAAFLPAAAAVPYLIGVLLFGTPPATALTPYAFFWNVAIPGEPLWALGLLYLLVPAGLLLAGVAAWVSRRLTPASRAGAGEALATDKPLKEKQKRPPAKADRKSAKSRPWLARAPQLLHVAKALFPFVLAAVIARFTFAAKEKCVRAVDFYADRGMWERVIDAARHDPANPPVVLTVDRALCHTGRLAEEMFSHPQNISALLIGTEDMLSWQWTGIWLDAGFVNAAEHNLAQMQEVVGEQPAILQKLALVHMAKGNIGTARIYLQALTRTLVRDDWADTYLSGLEHDPELSKDAQVQWLRSTMPKTAALIQERTADEWFLELLKRNPKNRPAFEYLMVLCLVAGRPDKVAENMYRMNDFDYARPYLPEHYAEAVVFYMANKGEKLDLRGWQIRAETRQRFLACMDIARRHKDDRPAMKRELREKFPGSYFRYLLVGESGKP
ncbi:MAG: DUF6057 family protein [bacterium]